MGLRMPSMVGTLMPPDGSSSTVTGRRAASR